MTNFADKRKKFEQLSRNIPLGASAKKFSRFSCPCCGYPTLLSRARYDICRLCDWEDDGQDDANSADFQCGPNGGYSLDQARVNFKSHLTMYAKGKNSSISGEDSTDRIKLKQQLIDIFEQLLSAVGNEKAALWQQALKTEQLLYDEVKRGIKRYEALLKSK